MAGEDRGQKQAALRLLEMLAGVLAPRVGILGDHLRPDAALARVMDDGHRRQMADLPAGTLDPQAEIGLL